VPMKKSRPPRAIISTVILDSPVVHAQSPANFRGLSTSIFTVAATPDGHPIKNVSRTARSRPQALACAPLLLPENS
jgi:hypothetical protein